MSNPVIQPYLCFGGRCEEALEFYRTALGAEVVFLMHFSQSPDAGTSGMIPADFQKKVMHCTFTIAGNTLMATDGGTAGVTFSGFSLSYSVATEDEAKKAFDALAAGGTVTMPLGKTFWSPCFGMVTDKFGLSWMVGLPGS